jgi:hypothetical protein
MNAASDRGGNYLFLTIPRKPSLFDGLHERSRKQGFWGIENMEMRAEKHGWRRRWMGVERDLTECG